MKRQCFIVRVLLWKYENQKPNLKTKVKSVLGELEK